MKKLLVALAAALTITQAVAGPVCPRPDLQRPHETAPPWSKRQCPKVCISNYSPGGVIQDFKSAATLLRNQGRLLIINGECTSACTIAADKARPNICMTKHALFRFHKGYDYDFRGCFLGRVDLWDEYSSDIAGWVRAHGGFPGADQNDDTLLDMSNQDAQAFFPMCEGAL